MTNIKAKMKVNAVIKYADSESVNMSAVYSEDKNSENYTYSQATPSANLSMWISNPSAQGYFKENKEYILTFQEANNATS